MLSTRFLLIVSACLFAWQVVSGQRLVVVVQDEEGHPLNNAHVSLRDARDHGKKPSAQRDGVFIFEEVLDGNDALHVKASGKQLNGCQWFHHRPDTIRMTMRNGPYYTLKEGSREARLVFDERLLELGFVDGVGEDSLRPVFAALGLQCDQRSCTYLKRKNGKKFKLHHNAELEAVRKNPSVTYAGLYAEHQKRHLHEGEGVVLSVDPGMTVQHQFKGIVRIRFSANAMGQQNDFGYVLKIREVLDQFGFRLTDTSTGYPDEGMLVQAFHERGVEAKPVSGLAGPFLIGQLQQLARHPFVANVELVVPPVLDH